MKAKLEFNLPEENEEYMLAVNAGSFHNVLWDLSQYLRNEIKYNEKNEFVPVQDKLFEIMEEYNVTL